MVNSLHMHLPQMVPWHADIFMDEKHKMQQVNKGKDDR